jgi:acyl dehydratase/putative sterol carrier protein
MDFQLGKSYDELKIGDKASFSKTISETDVYLFAGISGDFNPLHVNEEFAKLTPFKTRIAHGALPQSLIAPVLGTKLPGLGTVAVEITTRFRKPTFFGDTVTATAEVVEKIETKKRVRLKLTWTNQRRELIGDGEALVIPPPKMEELIPKGENPEFNTKEEIKMAFTDVKEVFDKMASVFNPSAAGSLNAVFQYDITGDGGGKWAVEVKEGTCNVTEGAHASPSVTMTMAADTWLAIVNKELNGMQAFMSGKLKATGDIMLAQRVTQLFPL